MEIELAKRAQAREEIYKKVDRLRRLPHPPRLARGGDSIFLSTSKAYPEFVRKQRVQRAEQQLNDRNQRFLERQITQQQQQTFSPLSLQVASSSSSAGSSSVNASRRASSAGAALVASSSSAFIPAAALKQVLRKKQEQWLIMISMVRFLYVPMQASKLISMIKLRKLLAPVVRRARMRIRQRRKMVWLTIASQWKMTRPTCASLKTSCGFFRPWPDEALADLLEHHLVPASDVVGTTLVIPGTPRTDFYIADSGELAIFSAKQLHPWSAVEMIKTRSSNSNNNNQSGGMVLLGDLAVAAAVQEFKFNLELRICSAAPSTNSSNSAAAGAGGGAASSSSSSSPSSSSPCSITTSSHTAMFWRIPHVEALAAFTEKLSEDEQMRACAAARASYLELTAPLDPSRVSSCLARWGTTFPNEFIATLSRMLKPRFYTAGTELFRQGERPRDFIIVVSGGVTLKPNNNQNNQNKSSTSQQQRNQRVSIVSSSPFSPRRPSSGANSVLAGSSPRRSSISNNHNNNNNIRRESSSTFHHRRASSAARAGGGAASSSSSSSYCQQQNNSSSSSSLLTLGEIISSQIETLGFWSAVELESSLVAGLSHRPRTAVCATNVEAWVCDFAAVARCLLIEHAQFALAIRVAFCRAEAATMLELQDRQRDQFLHRRELELHDDKFQKHFGFSKLKNKATQQNQTSSSAMTMIPNAPLIGALNPLISRNAGFSELTRTLLETPLFKNFSDDALAALTANAVPYATLPNDALSATLPHVDAAGSQRASLAVIVRGSVLVRTLREVERASHQRITPSMDAVLISSSLTSGGGGGGGGFSFDNNSTSLADKKMAASAAAAAASMDDGRLARRNQAATQRDRAVEQRDPGTFLPQRVDAPVVVGAHSALVTSLANLSVALAGTDNRISVTAAPDSIVYWWEIPVERQFLINHVFSVNSSSSSSSSATTTSARSSQQYHHSSSNHTPVVFQQWLSLCERLTGQHPPRLGQLIC